MDNSRQTGSESELFMVRLWRGELDGNSDGPPLIGRIQHVLSGRAHNFSNWTALINFMEGKIQDDANAMDGVQSLEEG